ncbi:TrmB family transcriptional regulator [Methanooceanicella nereidis]|nr:helix-turn-helix domain-containing protein [Methanocella sp. CWC-04]
MNRISTKLIRGLKTLGLSEYEAKVYSALVVHDYAEAKEIIEYLDISKPSVYESLRSLEEMGLVVMTDTKPSVYKVLPPEMAVKILLDIHKRASEDALEELKALEKEKIKEKGESAFLSLYGDAAIDYKIRDMFKNVKENISCIASDRYLPYIESLAGRDFSVNLMIISDDEGLESKLEGIFGKNRANIKVMSSSAIMKAALELKLPPGTELSKYKDAIDMIDANNMFIAISDDSDFLYIPPLAGNFSNALYTANKTMIMLTKMFFQSWVKSLSS